MERKRGHDHYYTETPQSRSDEREIDVEARGVSLRLFTDAGVFSKGRLDPGTALLLKYVRIPERGALLDLGCGYGPIGLVLAKVNPELDVYLVDPNERAVELARRNAARNGVGRVRVVNGKGFDPFDPALLFDAIVTNPPYRAGKSVVYGLVEESLSRLRPGGALTCVGRTKQGAKSLRAHMERVFGNVAEIGKGGGYRVMESRREIAIA